MLQMISRSAMGHNAASVQVAVEDGINALLASQRITPAQVVGAPALSHIVQVNPLSGNLYYAFTVTLFVDVVLPLVPEECRETS